MLKQNTLADATTELGFATETNTPLTRKVITEDGEVTVEGITPYKMKEVLNQSGTGLNTFKTPGEVYFGENIRINGVVQNYNGEQPTPPTPVTPGFTETQDILINEVKYGTLTMIVPDDYDKSETVSVGLTADNTSDSNITSPFVDVVANSMQGYSMSFSVPEGQTITRQYCLDQLDAQASSFIVATEPAYNSTANIEIDNVIYGIVQATAPTYTMNIGSGYATFWIQNNSSEETLVVPAGTFGNAEDIEIDPNGTYSDGINMDPITSALLDTELATVTAAIELKQEEPQPILVAEYTVDTDLNVTVVDDNDEYDKYSLTFFNNSESDKCELSLVEGPTITWETGDIYEVPTMQSVTWQVSKNDVQATDIDTEAELKGLINFNWVPANQVEPGE